ncbi:hypothetical protein DL770_001821 [Monosporascus sp. CRB-9-2]|nr:hypothetical protein DL770_001821 [Monosporascus sp. CRB-9-2]
MADKLCSGIDLFAGSKSTVNIGTTMSAFTRDVATQFILGKDYRNLDTENFNAGMTAVLQRSGAIWWVTKDIPWLGPTMKSLPLSFMEKIVDDATKYFLSFLKVRGSIAAYAAKDREDKNWRTIMDDILKSSLPPDAKTFGRISDEVGAITGAAFKTTAHTLRQVLYHVYSNKSIIFRLRAELSTLRENSNNDLAPLEQLPYLTAVLMEGPRLSPGVATRLARIAPDRGLIYGKWRIPAGAPCVSSAHPQLCFRQLNPADSLAWAELYIATAALVRRFDFQLHEAGPKDVLCVSDQFICGTEDTGGIKALARKVYN